MFGPIELLALEPYASARPLDLVAATNNVNIKNKQTDMEVGFNSDEHAMVMFVAKIRSYPPKLHISGQRHPFYIYSYGGEYSVLNVVTSTGRLVHLTKISKETNNQTRCHHCKKKTFCRKTGKTRENISKINSTD